MSGLEEVVFEGKIFRVVRQLQVTDDGQPHVREIVRHGGAVAVVPILDDHRVCLIENYRIAVDKALLELPAGMREPDEDPAQTARRELAEETGYRAGDIKLLATFHTSPGILDEQMHLYVATDLDPGPTALEGGEQIRPRPTHWPEAMEMVRDGRIQDAKTLVGLLYYHQFCRR